MEQQFFEFHVESERRADAGVRARSLADALNGVEGVSETKLLKTDPNSMDIGTIVQVVAASGAVHAIASGIAAWLRARRDVSLKYTRNAHTGVIQAEVTRIDPQAATRIIALLGRSEG